MDKASWLALAFAAAWLGLGVYLAFLSLRLGGLEQRLRRLEKPHD